MSIKTGLELWGIPGSALCIMGYRRCPLQQRPVRDYKLELQWRLI